MPIAREKSVKSSTPRRVDIGVTSKVSPKQERPASTEQFAEQFCAEMIQNLQRNVPETKHRLD
jgi:hypothetical protein